MPVQSQDSYEGLLKLLIGESIAEGVERAVDIAQPVGDIVEDRRDADSRTGTETDDK